MRFLSAVLSLLLWPLTPLGSSLTRSQHRVSARLIPPVIDVSPLREDLDSPASRSTIAKIMDACETFGFFHALNHGAEASSLRAIEATRCFFSLPLSAKKRLERSDTNSRGFTNRELTKRKVDMKELFDFGHVPYPEFADDAPENRVLDGFNQWPDDDSDFQRTMKEYYQECFGLGQMLLRGISLGIISDMQSLDAIVANHSSFMRLNYYPPIEASSEKDTHSEYSPLGISRHTDAGLLTVLTQDTTPGNAINS